MIFTINKSLPYLVKKKNTAGAKIYLKKKNKSLIFSLFNLSMLEMLAKNNSQI